MSGRHNRVDGVGELNNTNAPLMVKEYLMKSKHDSKKGDADDMLHYYQFITKKFVEYTPTQRGILIMYEMGYGKSIVSIAIAAHYKKLDSSRRVIVLLAKGLIGNYRTNIKKYTGEINNADYKFVSLNAGNMFKQMVNTGNEDVGLDDKLGDFINQTSGSLEGSLLIIDEAHNFFNAVTNGSTNALLLYDTIMNTSDIKLIFLTGTPMINGPFELVPCFNMLKGSIPLHRRNERQVSKTILFPELEETFNNYFVDTRKKLIKNKEKFKNRIYGLVSYYGSLYFEGVREDYPEVKPTIVEYVPMSDEQFTSYEEARDMESQETKKFSARATRFASKSEFVSTYRVKSRQICNFLIPEYARGPKIGRKMRDKYINKIKEEEFKYDGKLAINSPKFKKMLDNIKKHSGTIGYVSSEFVHGEGLELFARVLDANGYSEYRIDKSGLDMKRSKKTYAIVSGEISIEERDELVKTFNKPENKHGGIIDLLLLSKAGTQGIELYNARHNHKMEASWNMMLHEQVDARGIRYKSHENLPPKERNIQSYVYLSDYPTSVPKEDRKELTTDIDIYTNALAGKKLINSFMISMIEASIDCNIHAESFPTSVKKKIHCMMCTPTNEQLYHPIITKDMLIPNPCIHLKKKEVKAETIYINEKEYKYTKNPIKIYEFNEQLNGYTAIDDSDPNKQIIIDKILTKYPNSISTNRKK